MSADVFKPADYPIAINQSGSMDATRPMEEHRAFL